MKDKKLLEAVNQAIQKRRKLKAIYKELRPMPTWAGLGDYPLIKAICSAMLTLHKPPTELDITDALQDCRDKEFGSSILRRKLSKGIMDDDL